MGRSDRTPRVFLSYSRTDGPLAADLARRLRKADVWIDYRDLEPGRSWTEQLLAEVDAADVLVLLVSPRSLASDHVGQEWRRAQARGIPVVLAIGEPAPLPDALADAPWVDLRWRYPRQARRLSKLLSADRSRPTDPAPTSGRRLGFGLWRAAALASVAAVTSLVAAWTIVVPMLLVPLPRRILDRSGATAGTGAALLTLPFSAGFPAVILVDELAPSLEALGVAVVAGGVFGGWGTLAALSSPEASRWLPPRVYRGPLANWRSPTSAGTTTFRLDAAPEDRTGADTLRRALVKAGHREDPEAPAVIIHLVSNFHDTVEIDDAVVTIPVLLSDPDDELPPRLGQTQWIDMRDGLTRSRCTTFARLLVDRPALLDWLGTTPAGPRTVRPRGVQLLETVLTAIGAGLAALFVAGLVAELSTQSGTLRPSFLFFAALVLVGGGLVALMRHGGRRRSRWYRRRVLVAIVVTSLLAVAFDTWPEVAGEIRLGMFVAGLILVAALLALTVVWVSFRRDIRLWGAASGRSPSPSPSAEASPEA